VGGAGLAASLLDLIDEFRPMVVAAFTCGGKPYFPFGVDLRLRLLEQPVFRNGTVYLPALRENRLMRLVGSDDGTEIARRADRRHVSPVVLVIASAHPHRASRVCQPVSLVPGQERELLLTRECLLHLGYPRRLALGTVPPGREGLATRGGEVT